MNGEVRCLSVRSRPLTRLLPRSVVRYDCLSLRNVLAVRFPPSSWSVFPPSSVHVGVVPTTRGGRVARTYTGRRSSSNVTTSRHSEGVAEAARPWTATQNCEKFISILFYQTPLDWYWRSVFYLALIARIFTKFGSLAFGRWNQNWNIRNERSPVWRHEFLRIE